MEQSFYDGTPRSSHLQVEVVERSDAPGVWSVEAIDDKNEGACYTTVFYGPDSENRAREYAAMKSESHGFANYIMPVPT